MNLHENEIEFKDNHSSNHSHNHSPNHSPNHSLKQNRKQTDENCKEDHEITEKTNGAKNTNTQTIIVIIFLIKG